MNRIFIDMDGVLADFDRLKGELGVDGKTLTRMPEAYLRLAPIPGAIEAVRSLTGMGFECWIASKPPAGIAQAYADKVTWVLRHLPELTRRIILTHDKGMLGDEGDFLIDDEPRNANCDLFRGTLIRFGSDLGWNEILGMMLSRARQHLAVV